MEINKEDLENYPNRYRATLINSLSGIKTAVLVGTQSKEGVTNLAIFNSLIHIGANPPRYGLLFRPDTVRRHTLENILAAKEYTLNYLTAKNASKAHQTSAKYSDGFSEFDMIGFEPVFNEVSSAPFVADAIVKIAMQFEERIDININGTILIVGRLVNIEVDKKLIKEDGFVALHELDLLACSGLDAYYSTSFLGRYRYAKPEQHPEML